MRPTRVERCVDCVCQVSVTSAGTLLRKLEGGLRGVSHVIVDEILERDINVSEMSDNDE